MSPLTHAQIWQAIDGLAQRHGTSPSGLAKLAGLDPTTFNRSKRGGHGKPRWPSTESIAKVLSAVNASLEDLVALIRVQGGGPGPLRLIPLIGLTEAGGKDAFNEAGCPSGPAWEEIGFPELGDPDAYALEIAGSAMLPVFRDGDRIVVSPAAVARRGDRVAARLLGGEMLVAQLGRVTTQRIELKPLDPAQQSRVLPRRQVVFVHRIAWASQ